MIPLSRQGSTGIPLRPSIKENFDALEGQDVKVAGRLMSKRGMGKVSFCDLQDRDRPHPALCPPDEMDEAVLRPLQKV
jgi:lysyl-tRNA synthetase class 2